MEPQVTRATLSSGTQVSLQSQVRQFLQDFANAIQRGNIEDIMSFYSRDIVAFDMMPPLEFKSVEEYRSSWVECFTSVFEFPMDFSFNEQRVIAHGDVAFVTSIVHVRGVFKDTGKSIENWLRSTIGLKKTGSEWKIVHEHNSVPLDEKNLRGMMDLVPSRDTILESRLQ